MFTFVALVLLVGRVNEAPPLLSFDQLERSLKDPQLRLLDPRPKADYDKGHLPGAVWVDAKAAGNLAAKKDGLKDRDAWAAWAAPLGIGPDSKVIVCDGNKQLDAARLWWLLRYIGVKDVGLVNGNVPLWKSQNRPWTEATVDVKPSTFEVKLDRARLATKEDVFEALGTKGKVKVIDARSDAEYTGEKAMSKKGGRIPDACHLEWTTLVDRDGKFLEASELKALVEKSGVKPGEPVISHCQGGGRASVDAFVLERLGYPTRNYYLGWSDWGNADETPVQKGKPRKSD